MRFRVSVSITIVFAFLLVSLPVQANNNTVLGDNWILVELPANGCTFKDAAFFDAPQGARGVILAPGASFRKENWFKLATALQAESVAVLALSDGCESNIGHAVAYLQQRGIARITLLGSSLSGGATLFFLRDTPPKCIDQVIVLAPYGGGPITSERINKLFVVATQDRLGLLNHVRDLYARSAEPRMIKIYDGEGHAQHLFDGPFGADLFHRIVAFIGQSNQIGN